MKNDRHNREIQSNLYTTEMSVPIYHTTSSGNGAVSVTLYKSGNGNGSSNYFYFGNPNSKTCQVIDTDEKTDRKTPSKEEFDKGGDTSDMWTTPVVNEQDVTLDNMSFLQRTVFHLSGMIEELVQVQNELLRRVMNQGQILARQSVMLDRMTRSMDQHQKNVLLKQEEPKTEQQSTKESDDNEKTEHITYSTVSVIVKKGAVPLGENTPANESGASGTPANESGASGTPANESGASGTPVNESGASGT